MIIGVETQAQNCHPNVAEACMCICLNSRICQSLWLLYFQNKFSVDKVCVELWLDSLKRVLIRNTVSLLTASDIDKHQLSERVRRVR